MLLTPDPLPLFALPVGDSDTQERLIYVIIAPDLHSYNPISPRMNSGALAGWLRMWRNLVREPSMIFDERGHDSSSTIAPSHLWAAPC